MGRILPSTALSLLICIIVFRHHSGTSRSDPVPLECHGIDPFAGSRILIYIPVIDGWLEMKKGRIPS